MNKNTITLRGIIPSDLPIFFEHQLDPESNHMAAFVSRDPADRAAFDAHWAKILADESNVNQTITYKQRPGDHERIAGHIAQFQMFGEPEVGYWIGREHWNQGIATQALATFLRQIPTRPLYARAAKDNLASIRVLEKCGFKVSGEERSYATARGMEIEELIVMLEADNERSP